MSIFDAIRNLGVFRAKPHCDEGCPEGVPQRDAKLSAAITALGAKLARADGHAEGVEFASFVEVFPPGDAAAARDVHRLYRLARETTLGYEGYARSIAKRYDHCPKVLEKILDGLFHVAKADGVVTGDELVFLERVGDLFGLSPLTVRRLKAEHMGARAGDPYTVLGVAPDAPDDTVRAAWRRALSAHHPDRAAGAGLPQELVAMASAQAAAINAAFDAVMRERRGVLGAA